MNNTKDNFNTEFKTFAFTQELLGQLPEIIQEYGSPAWDGNIFVEKTLACGWDDSERTRLRALRFPETVSLTELTDGRLAYTALWSVPILEAFQNGVFDGVQELNLEQLQELIPVPEMPDFEESEESEEPEESENPEEN